MSAPPAQPPSRPSSATPNAGQPAAAKKKVNIFSQSSKKKPVKKLVNPAQRRPAPAPANGVRPGAVQNSSRPPANGAVNVGPPQSWNTDENGKYEEYSIVVTKKMIEQGIRYHAAKLHGKTTDDKTTAVADPYNEAQFVRPLRLHRRYARDKMEAADAEDAASGVDDKEREQMSARRAERQAEREENQKLIAPTGGEATKSQKKKPQKKVEEGRDISDPARQKRQQLRYEEARPWHLEDFEGKNIWVGSYEQALSEHSILLTVEGGGFKMVPVEKWYKFIQTNKVASMDSEEVEKQMAKKYSMPRWAMGTQFANEEIRKQQRHAMMQARKMRPKEEDDEVKREMDDGDFQADRDMLDLDVQDEFQDDDEGMLFQGEDGEDGDDIAKRIYLEMREAGLGGTGVKNEDADPEEEERRRQIAEREEKKKGRRLRKQLMKKEHQGQYESDSDDDPYASSSDSMDSDEEREKAEEERKKEEEARKSSQMNSDRSGASTMGTNTPSGRSEKRDPTRLSSKRPGDDSELSGNESSRKRAKGLNGNAVSRLGPGADSVKNKLARSVVGGSGSGSDTDTSRVGRPPKIKHKNSPSGSPSSGTPTGSRAASPAARSPLSPKLEFPTLQEVKDAIPPEGVEIKRLVAQFKNRMGSRAQDFIKLVKIAGTQDKVTQKIKLKGT